MALAQLVFEPAYDPYHTVFRIERLITLSNKPVIEIDRLRIADFYECFPIMVDQFRHRKGETRFRRISRTAHIPYSGKPDGRVVFSRMQPTQTAAIRTLASAGYLSPAALTAGLAEVTTKVIPAKLKSRLEAVNTENPLLTEFLTSVLNDFPLDGIDGLKHRSALLDHRYDAV